MKFHLLEHLMEDLHPVRSMEYLPARLYEAPHKSFKKAYGRVSNKGKSVMKAVIKEEVFSVYEKCEKKKNNTGSKKQSNEVGLRSVE